MTRISYRIGTWSHVPCPCFLPGSKPPEVLINVASSHSCSSIFILYDVTLMHFFGNHPVINVTQGRHASPAAINHMSRRGATKRETISEDRQGFPSITLYWIIENNPRSRSRAAASRPLCCRTAESSLLNSQVRVPKAVRRE